ncbi:MAG TPA: 2-phospho-L-lactate transferase CofD family protein, partial [Candidatus Methanoperedens sp.]
MILLSGGTGTPKLLQGIRRIIPDEEITVIVNTAEDIIV